MIPVAYEATFERVFYLSRVARALQRPERHLVHFAAARARVQTAGPAFARIWETGRMKLKDVYPLYLNNKAVQPNTDLEVIYKFTGEVAFRTALALPDVIAEAIAGAVRAAEPMAPPPSYEQRAVLPPD